MDVFFIVAADNISSKKEDIIEDFFKKMEDLFKDENYGNGLSKIGICFNCSSSVGQKFPTGLIVGYKKYTFNGERCLDISVKINKKELLSTTSSNFHQIGLKALYSVFDYILLHPIKGFESEKFVTNFRRKILGIDFQKPFISLPKRYLGGNVAALDIIQYPDKLGEPKQFSFAERKKLQEYLVSILKEIDKEILKEMGIFTLEKDEQEIMKKYISDFIFYMIDKIMKVKNFSGIRDELNEYIDGFPMDDLDSLPREIIDNTMAGYINLIKE